MRGGVPPEMESVTGGHTMSLPKVRIILNKLFDYV